jgi:predicted nucleic acid-binding protein
MAKDRGMTPVFADTFYWIALADFNDRAHNRAVALAAERASSPVVTTDEVLAEYLTFFAAAPEQMRRQAARSVRAILASPAIRVIPQSRDSFLAGLDLYAARPDKGYSLTDCISLQTMRREGLMDALTNDRHFEQEGFRALFRDS